MGIKRIAWAAAVLLSLSAYAVSHSQMNTLRAEQPRETKRVQALAVDPMLLKVVSGPFKGVAADYLILKASIFMGGAREVTPEDWDAVYTLLKQSLYLDPLFFQTGYYTQGLLSWRKGMQAKAVELLKVSAQHRYWDWEPMFYLGFDYFYYLKDNDHAIKYMRLAAGRPDAPPIVANLAARLSQRSGQTLTAIGLLKAMLEQTEDDYTRLLYKKRLDVYLGIHQLEQAIDAYEKSQGRKPETLEQLVSQGLISSLPTNPFGDHFIYEPDTGKVFFDDVR